MVSEKSFYSNYNFWAVKRKLTQPFYYNAETGGFEHYIQDATKFHDEDVAKNIAEILGCEATSFLVEFHKGVS